MAVVYQSGSAYINSTGLMITGRAKVAYLLFTSDEEADSVTLIDNTSGSTPVKLVVKSAVADETVMLDFSRNPLVFNTGIYCSAISANCHITLVLTNSGGS